MIQYNWRIIVNGGGWVAVLQFVKSCCVLGHLYGLMYESERNHGVHMLPGFQRRPVKT